MLRITELELLSPGPRLRHVMMQGTRTVRESGEDHQSAAIEEQEADEPPIGLHERLPANDRPPLRSISKAGHQGGFRLGVSLYGDSRLTPCHRCRPERTWASSRVAWSTRCPVLFGSLVFEAAAKSESKVSALGKAVRHTGCACNFTADAFGKEDPCNSDHCPNPPTDGHRQSLAACARLAASSKM